MIVLALAGAALARPYHADHGHEDLKWRTIETRFFRVHYAVSEDRRAVHVVDTSRTAQRVARAADGLLLAVADTAGVIARGPVHVLVSDHADGMTAFTLPQWGWIVLSADPGVEVGRLRGRADWAVDALAHELGHLVAHREAASLALGVSSGISLEGTAEHGPFGLGLELPIGPNEPYGWSEGVAEYWSEQIGVSEWTAGRRALLRTSALEGRLLDWDEWLVAVDKGATFDAERAYQQGYAFARWLARREGVDVFREMAELASERYRPSWAAVLRRVTGEDARLLWALWRADATVEAVVEAARIRAAGVVEGEPVPEAAGAYELWPRTSPDGRWSAEGRVGWVRVSDTSESAVSGHADRRTAWVPASFGSAYAFVPGQDAMIVAAPEGAHRRSRFLPRRADRWSQLWQVDLERGHRALHHRLTPIPGTLRARDPAVSPDGRRIAWLAYGDGTTNLRVADLDGGGARALSSFADGTWLQSPSWSPDGERVVVSAFREGRGDLWTVDVETGAWTRLTDDPTDELDPVWAADGIWFTADPHGVRDVFRLADGRVERMTRVMGGAACPFPTAAGDVLYTGITAGGLQAMVVARDELLFEPAGEGFHLTDAPLATAPPAPDLPSRPYDAVRSVLPPVISPIVRFDFPGRPVPLVGAYVRARDAVERVDLAVLGLVGEDLYGHARLVWRGLGPDLGVWGTGEVDRRRVSGAWLPERRGVGALGATVTGRVRRGAELRGDAAVLGLWTGERVPALRSERLAIGLSTGQGLADAEPGLALDLTVTRGGSTVPAGTLEDGERLGHYAFTRLELGLAGTLAAPVSSGPRAERRHRIEGTLYAGTTSRNVVRAEELTAGGDVPGALRLGSVEASVPFPGYAPYAVAGETLAVGGVRWVVPVAPRLRAGGGAFYASSVEVAFGGDAGNAWSYRDGRAERPFLDAPRDSGEPVLVDAVGELRLRAVLLDARWDSVLRLAWGLQDPGPPSEVAPEPARPRSGPRLVLGLGTGF